jgi:hypothetical protein
MVINFIELKWVCVLCGGVGGTRNLCYNRAEFFIELKFDFLTNYFEFLCVAFVMES